MTVSMLRNRGVNVWEGPDSWRVEPGPIAALDADIEPDLTNTAAFLAAGMVTGGSVAAAWPEEALQAGDRILEVLEAFGASVTRGVNEVTVGAERLTGADVDLAEVVNSPPSLRHWPPWPPARPDQGRSPHQGSRDRQAGRARERVGLARVGAQTEDGLDRARPLRGGLRHLR